MQLAVSNIGWDKEQDEKMYHMLQDMGFTGLEIAPTRIYPEQPYERLEEAGVFAAELKERYQLMIPSMQSIWFGQTESIFGTLEDRQKLSAYTKKAILFAEKTGCGNLVFGCPKNRNMPEADTESEKRAYYASAVDFFVPLAEFAAEHQTVLAMEANPPIYHTNFVNTTQQAYTFVTDVQSEMVQKQGFGINLDVGTMIFNEEKETDLFKMIQKGLISHVHISEPYLKPIQKRPLHAALLQALGENGYEKFVSVEMGKQEDISIMIKVLQYVAELNFKRKE